MRRHRSGITLSVALSSLLLPTSLPARLPDPPIRPAPSLLWIVPQRVSSDAMRIRIDMTEKDDHTVLGLVIGAGIGFVAGWAFYNTICEAVDNDCADSRLPHLAIGTGLGAGLGALIGSIAE